MDIQLTTVPRDLYYHEVAYVRKLEADRVALLSIAQRWAALDAGAWHGERHARDKAELLADTRAAIAKTATRERAVSQDGEGDR